MINFAGPSFKWPAVLMPVRILSLILLAVFRMLHVSHGTLITLLYQVIDSWRTWEPELEDPEQTAVFITGCASGFGYSLALRLDRMGYTVFAGVRVLDRRSQKLKASSSERLHVIRCDVAHEDQIQEACHFIRDNLKDTRLRAVVNNAGVIDVMPFEWKKDPDLEVRVNLLAPMHVSRIFLPLLHQTPGSRLVFVSSLAARFPLFACSVYCGSKAGLTAFATSLSRELRHQRVFVSIVEPGSYQTPMNDPDVSVTRAIESAFDCLPQREKESFDDSFLDELALDARNHAMTTTLDHSPVIDQLIRSSVSKSEPNLLVGVTSLPESLAMMFVESVPIDLTFKCLRTTARVMKRFLRTPRAVM